MPSSPNLLLIDEVAYARTTQVTVKGKLDASPPLLGIDGKVVDADARNPMFNISLKGEGDVSGALITGADVTNTIVTTGVTLISDVETTEKNEGGYNAWSVEAVNAPAA